MVAQIAFNALNKPVYYHCVLNNHFFYLQRFLFSAKCDAEVERAYNQMEKFKDQNVSRHQATMQRVRLKNYKTTRMHSSRMRTGRSLTLLLRVYLVPGGVPGPGGCTWSRGMYLVPRRGCTWSVRGVYLVPGGCTWSGGASGLGGTWTPPRTRYPLGQVHPWDQSRYTPWTRPGTSCDQSRYTPC